MKNIELKSTCSNLANLTKETQLNGYLLVRANANSEFIVESGANQVSGAVSGGVISGANGQPDKDRLRFFRHGEDRVQL